MIVRNAFRLTKSPRMARAYFNWIRNGDGGFVLNGHRFHGLATFSDYWSCLENRPTRGEMAAARKALATGGVAIDVGANIGVFAASMARASSTALVYAIEPVARTYSFLQNNTCHLPNVCCHRTAIAATSGWLHMTSHSVSIATNRIVKNDCIGDVEVVRAQTIDSFCHDNAISAVRLLKIDVEGAEVEVLKGMRRIRPDAIILEICPANLRAMDTDVDRLYNEIRGSGYTTYVIRDDGGKGDELNAGDLRKLTLANVLLCRDR